jgi:hypothetical protein
VATFTTDTIGGQAAQVLSLPQLANNQGVVFQTNMAANGGGTKINQYTIGYDIKMLSTPAPPSFQVFHNITPSVGAGSTSDDGELFRRSSDSGIGISSTYQGGFPLDTWARVMITMDLAAATPTLNKYINGTLVFSQTSGLSGVDGRFAIDPGSPTTNGLILFNDNDGESAALLVNSFYFDSRVLSGAEVTAFGGPTAAGFSPVPEPSSLALAGAAAAGWAVCRRRRASA